MSTPHFGYFFRPRHPSPLTANPRPGAESTPPPSGPRILDFCLPVTRRAGAAFYSTLSHQLSTSGAAARGLAPSPVEHLKASPPRPPQDSSDAWSRNGCTVVGVVVFILVSVPSPFTARFWCGGRDKWFPPTQPQPTVPRRQINHRRLGRQQACFLCPARNLLRPRPDQRTTRFASLRTHQTPADIGRGCRQQFAGQAGLGNGT